VLFNITSVWHETSDLYLAYVAGHVTGYGCAMCCLGVASREKRYRWTVCHKNPQERCCFARWWCCMYNGWEACSGLGLQTTIPCRVTLQLSDTGLCISAYKQTQVQDQPLLSSYWFVASLVEDCHCHERWRNTGSLVLCCTVYTENVLCVPNARSVKTVQVSVAKTLGQHTARFYFVETRQM